MTNTGKSATHNSKPTPESVNTKYYLNQVMYALLVAVVQEQTLACRILRLCVLFVGTFIWSMLSKYWIFVCAGMLLLISIQGVVIYRIIYLVFFLYFILTFQVCISQ